MAGIHVHHGDCLDVVRSLASGSIDSVVTDPPYALVSIVKRFGKPGAAPARSEGASGVYRRASSGFMGKAWDTGERAFAVEFWAEVLRVLKPGGHVLAFSGTRTYHRLACAVEDAGFEIRDQIGWLYGSGFPKSHNQGNGWGTALKPAWEPIVMARKPLVGSVAENVRDYGTGALNLDGCRVGPTGESREHIGEESQDRRYTENGGMNVSAKPGIRGGAPEGRWPANIIHDGSDEVISCFPKSKGQQGAVRGDEPSAVTKEIFGKFGRRVSFPVRGDTGSAARFFYSAKAGKVDRAGSRHPTVKPLDLMRYLCRLVTPPGGLVLDPFAGSGTTGAACLREGFRAVLIEREAEYIADIQCRLAGGGVAPMGGIA